MPKGTADTNRRHLLVTVPPLPGESPADTAKRIWGILANYIQPVQVHVFRSAVDVTRDCGEGWIG